MFAQHFSFERLPFREGESVTSPLRTAAHDALSARLTERALTGAGVTLLLGERGAGKSLLLEQFSRSAQDGGSPIVLFAGVRLRHSSQLLQSACQAAEDAAHRLGAPAASAGTQGAVRETLASRWRSAVGRLRGLGRPVALLVDDADTYGSALLADFIEALIEADGKTLGVALVMAARPQFEVHIATLAVQTSESSSAGSRPLGDALADVETHVIAPLELEDVGRFIERAVSQAGGQGNGPFSDAAIRAVAQHSMGLPGRVNQLCAAAMLIAYDSGETEITVDAVREAVEDLDDLADDDYDERNQRFEVPSSSSAGGRGPGVRSHDAASGTELGETTDGAGSSSPATPLRRAIEKSVAPGGGAHAGAGGHNDATEPPPEIEESPTVMLDHAFDEDGRLLDSTSGVGKAVARTRREVATTPRPLHDRPRMPEIESAPTLMLDQRFDEQGNLLTADDTSRVAGRAAQPPGADALRAADRESRKRAVPPGHIESAPTVILEHSFDERGNLLSVTEPERADSARKGEDSDELIDTGDTLFEHDDLFGEDLIETVMSSDAAGTRTLDLSSAGMSSAVGTDTGTADDGAADARTMLGRHGGAGVDTLGTGPSGDDEMADTMLAASTVTAATAVRREGPGQDTRTLDATAGEATVLSGTVTSSPHAGDFPEPEPVVPERGATAPRRAEKRSMPMFVRVAAALGVLAVGIWAVLSALDTPVQAPSPADTLASAEPTASGVVGEVAAIDSNAGQSAGASGAPDVTAESPGPAANDAESAGTEAGASVRPALDGQEDVVASAEPVFADGGAETSAAAGAASEAAPDPQAQVPDTQTAGTATPQNEAALAAASTDERATAADEPVAPASESDAPKPPAADSVADADSANSAAEQRLAQLREEREQIAQRLAQAESVRDEIAAALKPTEGTVDTIAQDEPPAAASAPTDAVSSASQAGGDSAAGAASQSNDVTATDARAGAQDLPQQAEREQPVGNAVQDVAQPPPASRAAAAPDAGPVPTYTVKRGDSLYAIGRRFGVSVDSLVRWNNVNNPSLIRPGERLFVSDPSGEQPAPESRTPRPETQERAALAAPVQVVTATALPPVTAPVDPDSIAVGAASGGTDGLAPVVEARPQVLARAAPSPDNLVAAARAGDGARLAALLSAGADPNQRPAAGETPLGAAAAAGQSSAVDVLLNAGAAPDAANRDGETPLMMAAFGGHGAIVLRLLQGGSNLEARSATGWTALTFAAISGQRGVLDVLMDAGAQLEAKALDGRTALAAATWNRHRRLVVALAERGANVNAADASGRTPLIEASASGQGAMVEALLALGADPKLADRNGLDAAGAARAGGHEQLAKRLGG